MIHTRLLRGLSVFCLSAFQLIPAAIILFYLCGFSNWTTDAGWISDQKGDCKFYTNFNYQNRSFVWDGGCKDGYAHGNGILVLFEDNREKYTFEGTLTLGQVSGKGRMRHTSDGDVYEGHFKNGKLHGLGHYFNDDGDHYQGNYEEGMRSGYGTYWYDPESPYFKYEGEWKDNQPNGQGTLYHRSGKEERGLFKKGILQSEKLISTNQGSNTPKHILITNDDGVEDMDRLICLAEAFSEFADRVVVAVSDQNRSSTSNRMIMPQQGYIQTECLSIDSAKQIYVYTVKGYPADCVLFAALGIFKENPIDLVISGINGGANEGAAWFGSGTIGAARTAALAGIPAIAVSGIDEDEGGEKGLESICQWVAQLAQSPIVEKIKPQEYLTVSIPKKLDELQGIKLVERAITFDNPPFFLENENPSTPKAGLKSRWLLKAADPSTVYQMPSEQDVFYYYQNYIVIVPMSVDENILENAPRYKAFESDIPAFKLE